MARSKVDVETRAGRWRKVIDGGHTSSRRGGTDSGDKMRSARRSRVEMEGKRAGGMAGLPGGETTPNVNTNYSPRASVATATALQPAAALTLPITSAFLD